MKRIIIIMFAVTIAAVSCTSSKKGNENPFFTEWKTPFGVPPFDQIENEHYMPAIDSGIAQARAEIEAITSSEEAPTFVNTVAAYDRAGELLN